MNRHVRGAAPIDNNYGTEGENFTNLSEDDGTFDCEGVGGGVGEPFSSDPLSSTVDARDWLDDVTSSGACVAPDGLAGRGSTYDWMRFWWDMTQDESVPPDELADIYVDACPDNWSKDSTGSTAEQVYKRIETSAGYHTRLSEYNAQKNNGVDR